MREFEDFTAYVVVCPFKLTGFAGVPAVNFEESNQNTVNQLSWFAAL